MLATESKKKTSKRAYEAEAKERKRSEEAAWKARQVLNFFTQVSEEDFPDRPEVRPIRRKLLEKALGYYKDFIDGARRRSFRAGRVERQPLCEWLRSWRRWAPSRTRWRSIEQVRACRCRAGRRVAAVPAASSRRRTGLATFAFG